MRPSKIALDRTRPGALKAARLEITKILFKGAKHGRSIREARTSNLLDFGAVEK